MKRCGHCRETKPLEAFGSNRPAKDGLNVWCRACCLADSRSPEKREKKRQYYIANRERLREAERQRYLSNPAPNKERARLWRAANPERARAHVKAWHLAHPEVVRANVDAWQAANPDSRTAANHRRRARLLSATAEPVTRRDFDALWERFGGSCVYCGSALTRRTVHWDHRVPLARGGEHSVRNLVPSCAPCNRSKSFRLVSEWLLECEGA